MEFILIPDIEDVYQDYIGSTLIILDVHDDECGNPLPDGKVRRVIVRKYWYLERNVSDT